jgi:hypothetical protein
VFFSRVSDLVFLCFGFFPWSQICSLRLVFPRHEPLHVSCWLLPIQQSSTTTVPVLHTRRVAYTRQGGHSLDQSVWIMTCLPRRSWGFFGGFEVFQRIFAAEEVSGGDACTTRIVTDAGATRRQSRFWLLFRVVFYYYFLFSSQSASMMLKCYWTIC